ncbi:ubiquitin carboxyl-terminal hydrolase 2-like [Sycon ciliatum]|uniref:ubiquitin carboxyl-terminal hydrolase 2-like n=1 Tax=Sycon ciliatum TaxID=27933 RepID=UPI0031F61C42
MSVWKLPDTLVVHLKRFDKVFTKLQHMVTFPIRDLNMASSCTPNSPEVSQSLSNTQYELFAVANHLGYVHGGHYTALCREESDDLELDADDMGSWLLCNDKTVSPTPPSRIVSPEAYLLFYRRRQRQRQQQHAPLTTAVSNISIE